MPHRLRRIRKKRGSRTHGWGRVGQHRGKGSQGRRNPGRHKALWSYVVKYEPDYFGKTGFTSPKSLKRKTNVINVGSLEGVASEFSTKTEKGKILLDLKNLGYTKLLGTGRISEPLTVRVGMCSKSAAEKVKKAGGQILLEKEQTGE
jgi:large subunit ribosomal protein L15